MDARQTQELLLALSANYREPLTPDQAGVWGNQLAPLDAAWAAAAAEKHMQHSKWFPTIADFLDEYETIRRAVQRMEQELGGPTRCVGCFDGPRKGWREVHVLGESLTLERCPVCNAAAPVAEHDKGCSCMVCHYGAAGAEQIRAGRHGMTDRGGDGGGQETLADSARRMAGMAKLREAVAGAQRRKAGAGWQSKRVTTPDVPPPPVQAPYDPLAEEF